MPYDGDDFESISDESPIREVAQEELFSLAVRFQRRWREILRDEGFVNTGEAISDITIQPQREGSDSYRIGGDVVQLFIAEFGRRPGAKMPPEEPLRDWVSEQSGMPSRGDDDFDNTVFLVRRSIAENGIPAIRAARRAWADVEDGYEPDFDE